MIYLFIEGLRVSNIDKEEMDNYSKIRKGGNSNLLFVKHNYEVVGCTNYQS